MSDGRDPGRDDEVLTRWSAMLAARASRVLAGTPIVDPGVGGVETFISEFSDEQGHRRPVDEPFLSAVLGVRPGPGGAGEGLDAMLWRRAALGQGAPEDLSSSGPISAQEGTSLEAWTEQDLSAMHALWRIGRLGDARLQDRCLDAAAWHVAETQPDNATNHPWAIHVFVALAKERGVAEGLMYAEGLLHASQLSLGRVDRFSGVVLWDAGRELGVMG